MENSHYVHGIWDVQELLKEWKLENIWPHLLAQKIDGEVLQMIKVPHIRMLLGNFPLGIQIRFEHHLEQWRYNIGIPLQQQYRCDGRCELETHKSSSSSFAQPHHHYSNEISETIIPNGVEIYNKPKQKNPVIVETPPPPKKKPVPSPKDPLITNDQTPLETITTRSQASTPSNKNEPPVPYTSKAQGPVPKVKLREILMSCKPDGPQLMQIYKHKKSFSQSERRRLVSVLAHYYLRNAHLKLSLQTSYALERGILKMFPNERLEMYRKSKRGSIYCKYMRVRKARNAATGCDNNNSEIEAGCFSDENSSLRGHADAIMRHSSEDDYTALVSNLAHDDDGDDGDEVDDNAIVQKPQFSVRYLEDNDVKDVKPTIIEDSELQNYSWSMVSEQPLPLQMPPAIINHILEEAEGPKSQTRKRCSVCYKKMAKERGTPYARKTAKMINTFCVKCNIPICIKCFEEHSA